MLLRLTWHLHAGTAPRQRYQRLIRELFIRPRCWGLAPFGMALFWAAESFAAWAALAAFGVRMNAAALTVGFATGMVFTRRTGPLGGVGILALVLPPTLGYSGAPLAAVAACSLAAGVAGAFLGRRTPPPPSSRSAPARTRPPPDE